MKLNLLVIEAGNLNLVEKKKIAIISFVELFHNIPEGFLAYYDRKDIDAHLCSIDVIELYSDHLAVCIDASKERILKDYKKNYKLVEMLCARVTRPLAAEYTAAAPPAHPAHSKNFGEIARRLLNERAAAAAETDDTLTVVVENRPAKADPPPHTKTFVDAALYIKLKATIGVICFLG